MNIWLLVGIALIAWAVYEIYTGTTWLHRKVARKQEPLFYWILIVIWIILAAWAVYAGIS